MLRGRKHKTSFETTASTQQHHGMIPVSRYSSRTTSHILPSSPALIIAAVAAGTIRSTQVPRACRCTAANHFYNSCSERYESTNDDSAKRDSILPDAEHGWLPPPPKPFRRRRGMDSSATEVVVEMPAGEKAKYIGKIRKAAGRELLRTEPARWECFLGSRKRRAREIAG